MVRLIIVGKKYLGKQNEAEESQEETILIVKSHEAKNVCRSAI